MSECPYGHLLEQLTARGVRSSHVLVHSTDQIARSWTSPMTCQMKIPRLSSVIGSSPNPKCLQPTNEPNHQNSLEHASPQATPRVCRRLRVSHRRLPGPPGLGEASASLWNGAPMAQTPCAPDVGVSEWNASVGRSRHQSMIVRLDWCLTRRTRTRRDQKERIRMQLV